ncbi:MAG: SPOR domain-containing protein [Sphingobium sp.]
MGALHIGAAFAQGAATGQADLSQPDAAGMLSRNMTKLTSDPHDVNALIGAGEAALLLDDPRAAVGFFGRADEISGSNGRIKAGLGRAMLQMQQTGDALRLMNQASALGYSNKVLLSDRGLARDLSGDQAGAQRDYLAALKLAPNDVLTLRRYAVSLGITGQVELAEQTIAPLLYRSDRAAWRDRAFILAMNGRRDQARNITEQVMPKQLANAIQPYMDRLPMLNAVQRAEAVHLGKFPPGLVNVSVASAAASAPASGPYAAPGSRPATSSPTAVAPTRPVQGAATRSPRGQVATASPPRAAQPRATPTPASSASVPPVIDYGRSGTYGPPNSATNATPAARPAPVASPAPAAPVRATPAPVYSAPASPRHAPTPSVPTSPASPATSTRTLAQIMAEIRVPDGEQRSSVTAVDLTDIARLQAQRRKDQAIVAAKAKKDAAAKAKAAADAKAKAEALAEKKRLAANPARIWVQVASGRSTSALAFDFRKLRKKYADVIGDKNAGTSAYGSTNRLVIGPFSSTKKAKKFLDDMEQAGRHVMLWNSDAGEEVAPIGGK